MKQVQQQQNTYRLTYQNACHHIQEIFGITAIEFDDDSISSISILYENRQISKIVVEYDKLMVTTSSETIYWPIQPFEMQMTPEEGMKLLKRKINA